MQVQIDIDDILLEFLTEQAKAADSTVEILVSNVVNTHFTQDMKQQSQGKRAYELRDLSFWLSNNHHDPAARQVSLLLQQYFRGGNIPAQRETPIATDKRISVL